MEERHVDRLASSPSTARRKRTHGEPVRVLRQARTKNVSDLQLFRRLRRRMGEMEQSGRIRFLATYAQGDTPGSIQLVERVPIGSDQDVERFRLLNEQSRVAAERLGSERIESGFAIRYHHNGREYVVAPYEEWGIEILRDSLQSLRVRDRSLGKRDRIV